MSNTVFEILKKEDELKIESILNKPLYTHRDHKWLLPLVVHAQEQGFLPAPCNIVGHDFHSDDCLPSDQAMQEIKLLVTQGAVNAMSVLNLCQTYLSKSDDDWLLAGMELGIFKNALILGVRKRCREIEQAWRGETYTDHIGNSHQILLEGNLLGEMLGYQERLSDVSNGYAKPLWDILGWHPSSSGFLPSDEKILLDFDLDCFTHTLRSCLLPWQDELWTNVFEKSGYGLVSDWNGQRMLEHLIKKAGIVTIATEPDCCGSDENMQECYRQLRKRLGIS
jgi:hypothetical protein